MTKSKTKISKQIQKKTNPVLVETIMAAKNNEQWLEVASVLSGPRRNFSDLNLIEINEKIKDLKDGEMIVVPGKVLSQGELDKKINIAALSFSGRAEEKVNSKGKAMTIIEGIKNNPEGKNIRILRK